MRDLRVTAPRVRGVLVLYLRDSLMFSDLLDVAHRTDCDGRIVLLASMA